MREREESWGGRGGEELSVPKKSQSQKNRCVFKSQSTKSQVCRRNRREIARKSRRKSQKNR